MSTRYHQAAIDGYQEILKEATKKDVNTTDGDGMTPTILAAYHGHLDVLEILCHRGGDPDKSDIWGNTPLHHAAEKGHASCVSFLVNFGANIFALDNKYRTPLDVAAIKDRIECVKILDGAANKQASLNPKKVERLKEQAVKDADRKVKECEKIQDRHQNQMAKNYNKSKGGTVNSSKGTLSGTVGARFSTPSTISSISKGLKDTFQLKLKKKGKNTIDRETVSNVIFANDESVNVSRPKAKDVFNENEEENEGKEEESIFNRPGLGNMMFRRNLASGIGTDFDDLSTVRSDTGFQIPSELFTEEAENGEESDDEQESNVAWDEDEVELDDEDETSALQVFLVSHGLIELFATLIREKIDLDALMLCSNEDLQSINIPLGPRKKVLNAIEKRKNIIDKPGKTVDTKL
ncbi:ankyrin repeat and SAM domain-containing protein 4B [Xenopus tropicalis]|uniref:Ankyrin repeat and SAM domain-containing protein 4B n=1 Tax=Xenopus tropicalis TaxID=8364 RepID=B2GUL7_XENTR|nr:ankyrin repeat and SAM domain-containing protein 4B [Xenopus tropicalis]AAI66329.1 LOC100158613 protein [Xenopus tropicalis]|eukprot:NP_001121501.1 ankyrin repeat and SAM domain-containing protein 4B [Xenopus tropicalis]